MKIFWDIELFNEDGKRISHYQSWKRPKIIKDKKGRIAAIKFIDIFEDYKEIWLDEETRVDITKQKKRKS